MLTMTLPPSVPSLLLAALVFPPCFPLAVFNPVLDLFLPMSCSPPPISCQVLESSFYKHSCHVNWLTEKQPAMTSISSLGLSECHVRSSERRTHSPIQNKEMLNLTNLRETSQQMYATRKLKARTPNLS